MEKFKRIAKLAEEIISENKVEINAKAVKALAVLVGLPETTSFEEIPENLVYENTDQVIRDFAIPIYESEASKLKLNAASLAAQRILDIVSDFVDDDDIESEPESEPEPEAEPEQEQPVEKKGEEPDAYTETFCKIAEAAHQAASEPEPKVEQPVEKKGDFPCGLNALFGYGRRETEEYISPDYPKTGYFAAHTENGVEYQAVPHRYFPLSFPGIDPWRYCVSESFQIVMDRKNQTHVPVDRRNGFRGVYLEDISGRSVFANFNQLVNGYNSPHKWYVPSGVLGDIVIPELKYYIDRFGRVWNTYQDDKTELSVTYQMSSGKMRGRVTLNTSEIGKGGNTVMEAGCHTVQRSIDIGVLIWTTLHPEDIGKVSPKDIEFRDGDTHNHRLENIFRR